MSVCPQRYLPARQVHHPLTRGGPTNGVRAVQPSPGRLDREELSKSGAAAPGSDSGGDVRTGARSGEVRLPQGLKVLDVRDVVDPPGDRAGAGGSSGQRTQYRLNRGGDVQLDRALHMIAITRANHDPATKEYLARKERDGKPRRARCAASPDASTASAPYRPSRHSATATSSARSLPVRAELWTATSSRSPLLLVRRPASRDARPSPPSKARAVLRSGLLPPAVNPRRRPRHAKTVGPFSAALVSADERSVLSPSAALDTLVRTRTDPIPRRGPAFTVVGSLADPP